MTKVQRRAYLSNLEGYPCFIPTPHGCLPYVSRANSFGSPWERGLQNQCKARSSQKNNRSKRKFRGFPHQISGPVSVKVRVV